MSAVEKMAAPVDWTIATKLANRDATRETWEKDFTSNMATIAAKIAESVSLDIFEALGRRLNDSYAPPLSADACLHLNYSLGLKRDSGKIKEWAKDGAELQPFKEWFEAFEGAGQKRKDGGHDDMEFSSFSSKSFVRVADKNIEVSYFQGQMAKIGHLLAETVTNNLQAFAAQPGNEALRSKVEWYRKAEKFVSSLSDSTDDVLRVQVWVDSKKPAEASGNSSICVII